MRFERLRVLLGGAPQEGAPEPDFLCVGMVKAATDWLFDQLLHHPDFWMPPVKELRYLRQPVPVMDNTVRKLVQYRRKGKADAYDPDLAFLEEAAALAGRPRDLEKYGALFRFKGSRLSGDISPGYYDLEGEDIARIAAQFPRLRIVLMLRDPLERVWSHISMRYREGHFDAALLNDVSAFSRWFAESEVRRACFATLAARRWGEFAPKTPFRHFFFDDVEHSPAAARAEIIAYLGGNPRKKSGMLEPGYNRKANVSKLPMPAPVKALLLDELAEEFRGGAELFGGHAKKWVDRYGL